jgi:hypothetical protein
MKLRIKEICDLLIFDKNGDYITRLNTLRKSSIRTYNDNGVMKGSIEIKDALFNTDLFEFIHSNSIPVSAFNYLKNNILNTKGIKINNHILKKDCQLIAVSIWRECETQKDIPYLYLIPNAEIRSDFYIEMNNENSCEHENIIDIMPNTLGDLFELIPVVDVDFEKLFIDILPIEYKIEELNKKVKNVDSSMIYNFNTLNKKMDNHLNIHSKNTQEDIISVFNKISKDLAKLQ